MQSPGSGSISPERLGRIHDLSRTGRDAAVVSELDMLPAQELEQFPLLSLLYGIAHGRLGRPDPGRRWVAAALAAARAAGDAFVAARSLNASGAIAFQEGRIDEAIGHFADGMAEASRAGDHGTVGRCANNLGIIANLRGEYGQAVSHYTAAITAYQRAAYPSGVAETLHNLALTYRDQRAYTRALDAEERAARVAEAAGDVALCGMIHCGRGEIDLRLGDIPIGRVAIERALRLHREVGDVAGEIEALRALAEAMELSRQPAEAEATLREVIDRARDIHRPLLATQGMRDLARLLHRQKRHREGIQQAREARRGFAALGAVFEVARLDGLLREMGA